MSNITEAVTAYSTLCLALVTFGLVVATFWLGYTTRRLAQDARGAAYSELRAYVWISEANMLQVDSPNFGLVNNWRITVLVENGGKTPAKNLRTNIHWDSFEERLPQDFAFPDSVLPPTIANLGPGGSMHSRHVDIPMPVLDQIARRLKFVYVWGWVDYDDVIDSTARHRTEFCFQILKDGEHVSYMPYGRFNGADNDCLRGPAPFHR